MRTKRFVDGLNNSQKIRVIVNGVGFHTTVAGAFDMAFRSQQVAVTTALNTIGLTQGLSEGKKITGLARRYSVYDHEDKLVDVDVQVDLV